MARSERLFEKVERVDEQEARSVEKRLGSLAYLQRSKCPEVIQRCEWYEEWFAQYPQEHKPKLKSDLKSKKWVTFIGALFELQIYRMLYHRLSCLVQIDPDVSGKTPDFLVACEGEQFYLEATVRHDAETDTSNRRRAEEFTEMLRAKLTNLPGDLWLNVISGRFPERNTSWKIAGREIQKWVNGCDVKEVARRAQITKGFSIENCQVKATLFPCRKSKKAPSIEPALGIQGSGVEILRATVEEKAKKYRSQDLAGLPYIIAVNLSAVSSEWIQYTDGGEYNKEVAADADADVLRVLCSSPTGREFVPKLKHVNGVIVVHNGTLGNEKVAGVKLYRNGNADIPKCLQFLLDYQSFGNLLGLRSIMS